MLIELLSGRLPLDLPDYLLNKPLLRFNLATCGLLLDDCPKRGYIHLLCEGLLELLHAHLRAHTR